MVKGAGASRPLSFSGARRREAGAHSEEPGRQRKRDHVEPDVAARRAEFVRPLLAELTKELEPYAASPTWTPTVSASNEGFSVGWVALGARWGRARSPSAVAARQPALLRAEESGLVRAGSAGRRPRPEHSSHGRRRSWSAQYAGQRDRRTRFRDRASVPLTASDRATDSRPVRSPCDLSWPPAYPGQTIFPGSTRGLQPCLRTSD